MNLKTKIHEIENNLFLIDLDQQQEGFRKFISSWIFVEDKSALIIDPGPASTIPLLKSVLDYLKVKSVKFVLLTHIHLDHAGGVGQLLKFHPESMVICHPKAVGHIKFPEKLWEGSIAVLGNLADIYGQPIAAPEANISFKDSVSFYENKFRAVATPGHAPHHLSFITNNKLFIGEAAGTLLNINGVNYCRPATPPVFNHEVYADSLKRLSQQYFNKIYFAHYGFIENNNNFISQSSRQLELWVKTVLNFLDNSTEINPEIVFEELIKTDPLIAGFHQLPDDIKKREKYFCLNSINGIIDYLNKKNP